MPSPSLSAPILFDTFEYAVNRDEPDKAPFFTPHGWSGVKSNPSTNHANGYLYTTASIPGYSGSFPGGGSRVLAVEALAGTTQEQTDFYLLYGQESGPSTQIPGNVWFQFWIYVNRSGSEMSQFGSRNKFLYPCNGPYPCNTNKWMLQIGADTSNPHNVMPNGLPSNGEAYMVMRDNTVGTLNYSLAQPGNENKFGQQNISAHIAPNTWTLVKLHWDTSTTSGRWEAWVTPRGQPTVKVAEWISGVTPGFTWSIPSDQVGGHRMLKMPTTFPGPNNTEFYDAFMYIDDFVMAPSESDLPTYGTTPPPPPPSNPCDLNGGGVTVVDVQLCVNQALSISPCTTGDIDQNSQCNVIDVQRVVNAALGGPCVTQ